MNASSVVPSSGQGVEPPPHSDGFIQKLIRNKVFWIVLAGGGLLGTFMMCALVITVVLITSLGSSGGLAGQWAEDTTDITSICSEGLVEFESDGTLVYTADFMDFRGTYEMVDNDTIRIDMQALFSPIRSGDVDYRIDGGVLTLIGRNGTTTYERTRANCN